jgi:protein-tyrosine phosphatase
MRHLEDHNLWLGNARDGRNVRAILDAAIQAVVDLALEEPPAVLVRELTYCRFPLLDGAGNPDWLLRAAVETATTFLRAGTPTLVCCGAGMSRAPVIVAAAIASLRGCSFAEALSQVIPSGSGDVSSTLHADLSRLKF